MRQWNTIVSRQIINKAERTHIHIIVMNVDHLRIFHFGYPTGLDLINCCSSGDCYISITLLCDKKQLDCNRMRILNQKFGTCAETKA